ncbi:MAG: class I SAM-dependent methyltransferase [Candidatus Odinarchaeota archaeon]
MNEEPNHQVVDRVATFYDNHVVKEWTRKDRHPLEFIITEHYLKNHLPPKGSVIADIGGGPGRYTVMLARWGYSVSLVDLSRENVRFARKKIGELGLEANVSEIEIGDARNLSRFKDGSFDAVLLLGPLYHLVTEEDRIATLLEAKRILKGDGVLFISFLNRYASIIHGFTYWPEGILEERDRFRTLLEEGHSFNFTKDENKFAPAYYIRVQEISPLLEKAGLQIIKKVACEGILGGSDRLKKLDDEIPRESVLFKAWVNLILETCEDEATLGSSTHILCVCKKKRALG